MTRIKIFLFLLLISPLIQAQDIPAKPNPPRLVNDFAGMLNQGQIAQLEQKLKVYSDTTSSQIAIVIVKTVQPYDISEYAFKLGTAWGVGKKDKNNGVVVLWASDDRKIFIAPGRGLEGAIPDAYCKRIVEQIIIPNFKQQQYYEGLDQATDKLINYAQGEFKGDPQGSNENGNSWIPIIFFIVIIILFIWLRTRGGGGRGGGGGFFPFITYSNWGSSSGSWGGSSGGDSGSGGFGGFGGGDFGGGGAGGNY